MAEYVSDTIGGLDDRVVLRLFPPTIASQGLASTAGSASLALLPTL